MISVNFPFSISRREGTLKTISELIKVVDNVDLYTDVFFSNDKETCDTLKVILFCASMYKYTISLHATPFMNMYTNYESKKSAVKGAVIHHDMLKEIRKTLDKFDLLDTVTVVYHPGMIDETEEPNVIFFNTLCKLLSSGDNRFIVLAETLSANHPVCDSIESSVNSLLTLVREVKYSNFGICCDIGHTHLNSVENSVPVIIPHELLQKVKFTHIHGYSKDGLDHTKLLNTDMYIKELTSLASTTYKGHYSLEYDYNILNVNLDTLICNILSFRNEVTKLLEKVHSNKRAVKRVTNPSNCFVIYSGGKLNCKVTNISEYGCCLQCEDTLSDKDLNIVFVKGNVTLCIKLKSLWVKGDKNGYTFIDMSDIDYAVLNNLIHVY